MVCCLTLANSCIRVTHWDVIPIHPAARKSPFYFVRAKFRVFTLVSLVNCSRVSLRGTCANRGTFLSLMSIAAGNHPIAHGPYDEGTQWSVGPTPPQNPRPNYSRTFSRENENAMTARTWDPRR